MSVVKLNVKLFPRVILAHQSQLTSIINFHLWNSDLLKAISFVFMLYDVSYFKTIVDRVN